MPLYDFICANCGTVSEVYRRMANSKDAPTCCARLMTRYYSGARVSVVPDIEPYLTVAADKETKQRQYIRSRKDHREFLKRNRYEEAGNDPLPFTKRG